MAWLEVIAQTQLKLKSLRSNRRAQANRQQFDRKNETGKKFSKILRFSSVNFDRFHREKTNFRDSSALTSPIISTRCGPPKIPQLNHCFWDDESDISSRLLVDRERQHEIQRYDDEKDWQINTRLLVYQDTGILSGRQIWIGR